MADVYIIKNKTDDSYHLKRGLEYLEKKQLNEAIDEFDQAIAINPKDDGFFYNRGNAYNKKNLYKRAITEYDNAIILNPNNEMAYLNLGKIYSDKNSNSFLEFNPNIYWGKQAGSNNQSQYYEKAISDFSNAIELNPNNEDAYFSRGFVYSNVGKNDKAVADYTQVITINPNNYSAYLNRDVAYSDMDLKDKAIADYNQAIALNPGNEEAKIILAELSEVKK
jgi:tetratricopeptide (TPR) repeat protein